MLWFRHLLPFAVLAGLATAGVTGFRAWNKRFNESVRERLGEALARQDLRADVGRLSLDPLRGLVAKKFRLYGGPQRNLLLATFDEMRLDLDVSRYLQRQQFINSLELDRANLSLPFDPTEPKAGSIKLTNVSARIVASGDRFEIRRAEADFYGTRVTLSGSLLRPVKETKPKGAPKPETDVRAPLEFVEKRRATIEQVLKYVRKFRAQDATQPPRLELRVEGDLDHPQNLHAWARLHGENLRYGGFRMTALDASAEYQNGELFLKDATVRDDTGRLTFRGNWRHGSGTMPFSVASTINLPALVGELTTSPLLREVVFYQPEAMKFQAEGVFTPGSSSAGRPPAVRALGSFSAGRFNTRGAMFDGAGGTFFVDGQDFFLRELRLRHATGTATGEAMKRGPELRYRTDFRMSPAALEPFVPHDAVRAWLGRLKVTPGSLVRVQATGNGLTTDLQSWRNTADVELRDVEFDGDAIRRCDVRVQQNGPLTVLTAPRLVRPEGEGSAERITIDHRALTFRFEGVQSALQPLPVIRWFAPIFSRHLVHYSFATPPTVRLSGLLAPTDPTLTDLDISVQSTGLAEVPVPGAVLTIHKPVATLSLNKQKLAVDVTAEVPAGSGWRHVTVREATDVRFIGEWQFDHGALRDSAWQLFANDVGAADYRLPRQTVALESGRVALEFRRHPGFDGPMLQADVKARPKPGTHFAGATLRGTSDVHVLGWFDPDPQPGRDQTQWQATVESADGLDYAVGARPLPLTGARIRAEFARGRMQIPEATARLFGGAVSATVDVESPMTESPEFAASVKVDGVQFSGLTRHYSPDTETGGQLSGTLAIAGSAAEPEKLRGSARFTVKDGDIFALPLLGPLSPLLSAVLPGTKTGYSKAREATASLTLTDRVIKTEDFEALTTAFVIKGGGSVHLDTKAVDLDARVNTRGPTGLLLYPVSKLLEYEARGTTADPGWRPAVLSLPGRLVPDALKPAGNGR